MTQTVRTVNDLILAAFYLIGEYAENEPVEGIDFERGFELLNLLIDHFSGEDLYIPITQRLNFTLLPGKRDYVFSNVAGITPDVVSNRIAGLLYCNINYFQIKYPVNIITRSMLLTNYFNNFAQTLPAYVLVENEVEKTTLSFYNTPDQEYNCEINAKFYLNKFIKHEPIRNTPLSLQRFFIYALGRELTQYYPSSNWAQTAEDTYQKMIEDLLNTNDIDMSVQPSNILRNRYLNYNGLYSNILGG